MCWFDIAKSVYEHHKHNNNNDKNKNVKTPILSYLVLTITATADPLTIKATTTNTHPTITFSILDWDTALDESAYECGVFSMYPLGNEEKKKTIGPDLKYRRMMPPPLEQVVEIAPGESITKEFEIPQSPLDDFSLSPPLESGRTYRVCAEGRYMIVWLVKKRIIKRWEQMCLGMLVRVLCGDFVSDEAEFVAP